MAEPGECGARPRSLCTGGLPAVGQAVSGNLDSDGATGTAGDGVPLSESGIGSLPAVVTTGQAPAGCGLDSRIPHSPSAQRAGFEPPAPCEPPAQAPEMQPGLAPATSPVRPGSRWKAPAPRYSRDGARTGMVRRQLRHGLVLPECGPSLRKTGSSALPRTPAEGPCRRLQTPPNSTRPVPWAASGRARPKPPHTRFPAAQPAPQTAQATCPNPWCPAAPWTPRRATPAPPPPARSTPPP